MFSPPFCRYYSEYLSFSRRHVLQISPLRQSDFGQWSCHPAVTDGAGAGADADADASNDLAPPTSHTWNLVVLPSVERAYVFQDLNASSSSSSSASVPSSATSASASASAVVDRAGSQVWGIFRRDGTVVTVQEGDGLQLYCAVLVRKERATEASAAAAKAKADRDGGGNNGGRNFLRWTGSNPGAKDSEPTMDLSSQVRVHGHNKTSMYSTGIWM